MKRALAVSCAVHVAVFWWLLRSPSSPVESEKIEVEFKEIPPTAPLPPLPSGTRGGKRGRNNDHASAHALPGLGQLRNGGDFGLAKEESHPHSWTDIDTSGWSEDDWGYGGGGAGGMSYMGRTLQIDKLREEVDNMLFYPGILARRNIEGTINTRLVFGKGSKCDWKKTQVKGANPYLRVYIFALLKKLCSLETIEHIDFPEHQVVDMSFRFFIGDVLDSAHQQRGVGNVLLFTRMAIKMPLEYHIGPLTGTLLFPYVSLDFPWVVEHWETWVEHKDPLRDFRSDE